MDNCTICGIETEDTEQCCYDDVCPECLEQIKGFMDSIRKKFWFKNGKN